MEAAKNPARWMFFAGLGVFLALLLVQFYQVGDAVFEEIATGEGDFDAHQSVGIILRFFAPALFVVGIFAGLKRSRLIVAGVFGVLALLQPGFAEGASNQWLHSVNALLLGWLAFYLFWDQLKSFSEWSGISDKEKVAV